MSQVTSGTDGTLARLTSKASSTFISFSSASNTLSGRSTVGSEVFVNGAVSSTTTDALGGIIRLEGGCMASPVKKWVSSGGVGDISSAAGDVDRRKVAPDVCNQLLYLKSTSWTESIWELESAASNGGGRGGGRGGGTFRY
jgi:hypothetical protein